MEGKGRKGKGEGKGEGNGMGERGGEEGRGKGKGRGQTSRHGAERRDGSVTACTYYFLSTVNPDKLSFKS